MSSSPSARPYRSKRHRPCDQCRARKLGCQTEGGIPCQRCRAAQLSCTFDNPPPKRERAVASFQLSESPLAHLTAFSVEDGVTVDQSNSPAIEDLQVPKPGLPPMDLYQLDGPSPSPGLLLPDHPPAQYVRSIDQLDQGYAQLFGASAESDPWLLRHCRFDDAGMKQFYKVHFRNAGGVPTTQRIPIHFLITSEDLSSKLKQDTRAGSDDMTREYLDNLVPPEYGRRLIALFVKYVFPALPVISRSQMGLSTASSHLPELEALAKIPVHLLAAIYGSAFPFVVHDDQLCVFNAYHKLPADKVWRMVYEILSVEIHTPRLAVLQAALLYLHRHPSDESQYSASDTPFVWSFVGQVVGLACSLGIHIECRMWGIPAWEKRLRRRLWWAVYAEDKWRSLMLGRPPYIHRDEWDVSDLDEGDFLIGPRHGFSTLSCDNEIPFRFLVSLARIAEEIHTTFYTLRASQILNADFPSSAELGRGLLEKLNEWYSTLPEAFHLPNWNKAVHGLAPYPTSIHFAYLLLVLYVYRAMLRPLAKSSSPPVIFDLEDMSASSPLPVDDSALDFADFLDLGPECLPDLPIPDVTGTNEITLHAAEKCATILVNFTRRLTSSDFTSFWYSWSRIGFATVSNFVMLLFVQAPNSTHATRGRNLVESWLQVLRFQSQGFPLVRLGLARLDAFKWAGVADTFALPPHVYELAQCND